LERQSDIPLLSSVLPGPKILSGQEDFGSSDFPSPIRVHLRKSAVSFPFFLSVRISAFISVHQW
jgi:hypothetical protein